MNVVNKLINVNYTVGREGKQIDLIILHTMQGFLTGTDSWFNNPAAQVSAHEGVGLNGDVHLYVDPRNTAWAAGNRDYNDRAINIETEDNRNPDGVVRTAAQFESVAQRVALHARIRNIPLDRNHVLRHGEVPGTTHKNCPGNLDVDGIVARARAINGSNVAVVVSAVTQPSFIGIPTTRIAVSAPAGAKVRSLPNVDSAVTSVVATTKTFDIDGYVHTGVVINANGYTGDLWVHSTAGHWVFGPLTTFEEAHFAPQPAVAVSLNFVEQPGSLRVTPAIGANLRSAPQTDASNIDHAVNFETTLATVGYTDNGASVDGNSKWWRLSDGLYVSDAVVAFITPETAPATLAVAPPTVIVAPPAPDNPEAAAIPALLEPEAPAEPATPPVVKPPADPWDETELDTSKAGYYIATDTVGVEDMAGQLGDARVVSGQRVSVAGTYELGGVEYARTTGGVANGSAYAIPTSILKPYSSETAPGGSLSDIQKPAAPAASQTATAKTGREQVLAAIAYVANLLDKINPFVKHK